jgi:hypothetical protein
MNGQQSTFAATILPLQQHLPLFAQQQSAPLPHSHLLSLQHVHFASHFWLLQQHSSSLQHFPSLQQPSPSLQQFPSLQHSPFVQFNLTLKQMPF